ncbi:hypothetical protein [Tropicimonas aquimaris]|uniref:Oligosaccharide repeat unit polymerase n=1 Tax=Tropicimonas aquimaris TaxID=914152 RepID=A0ABW3IX37_9RHOB
MGDVDLSFNLLLSAFLLIVMIRWRSPLILFGAQFALGSLFRSDSDSIMVNVGWFLALLTISLAYRRNGIRLDCYQISYRPVPRIRWLIFIGFFFVLMLLWLQEAGITAFDSSKRTSTAGAFTNLFSGLLNLYFALALAVLMFYRRGQPKWLLWFSVAIFLVFALKAYLGSNRGVVALPVFLVLFCRFAQVRRFSHFVRFVATAIVFGGLGLRMILVTTAERAGVDLQTGLFLLRSQLAGYLGNGYSPLRDQAILEYVQSFGTFIPPITIFAPIYGFIPRVLWPGKPDVGVGRIVGEDVFNTGGGYNDRGAGIPISVPAEMEAIFGHGGFWIGLFFVVLLMVFLGRKCLRHPALILPIMLIAPSMMGSDFGRLGMLFIILSVSLLLCDKFLGVGVTSFQRSASQFGGAGWKRGKRSVRLRF